MALLDGLLWLLIENVQFPGERVEPEDAFPEVPPSELERANGRVLELYLAAGEWGREGMDALRRSQEDENRYRAELKTRFRRDFADFSMDSMLTAYSKGLRGNR